MIKAEFYICADKLDFDEIASLVNGEGKVMRSEEIKFLSSERITGASKQNMSIQRM